MQNKIFSTQNFDFVIIPCFQDVLNSIRPPAKRTIFSEYLSSVSNVGVEDEDSDNDDVEQHGH